MTFKKNSARQRAGTARRRCPAQSLVRRQPDLDPEHLVFIDETGASTKMARLRGRALRGQRCRAPVPHGHWKTTTFTGALRLHGMTAPMVLDGPMNGRRSTPTSSRSWSQRCGPATRSSWTTCPHTKAPTCAGHRSGRSHPAATCRPTRPTSTRSRTPSPNSKPSCEKPQHGPSTIYGTSSADPLHVHARRMRQLLHSDRI